MPRHLRDPPNWISWASNWAYLKRPVNCISVSSWAELPPYSSSLHYHLQANPSKKCHCWVSQRKRKKQGWLTPRIEGRSSELLWPRWALTQKGWSTGPQGSWSSCSWQQVQRGTLKHQWHKAALPISTEQKFRSRIVRGRTWDKIKWERNGCGCPPLSIVQWRNVAPPMKCKLLQDPMQRLSKHCLPIDLCLHCSIFIHFWTIKGSIA